MSTSNADLGKYSYSGYGFSFDVHGPQMVGLVRAQ